MILINGDFTRLRSCALRQNFQLNATNAIAYKQIHIPNLENDERSKYGQIIMQMIVKIEGKIAILKISFQNKRISRCCFLL